MPSSVQVLTRRQVEAIHGSAWVERVDVAARRRHLSSISGPMRLGARLG
ncbi:hypothetical protein [Acidiferrimicrobium sp. IK]|nr:hypothetical protein [Acidiferrimicrobium sp. IK]